MTSKKSNTRLAEIACAMRQAHGLDITPFDEAFLLKALDKRLEDAGLGNAADYLSRLRENPVEAGIFFNSLNISYSEFFRNPLTFAVLEQMVLPALAGKKDGRAELRVWSAGCASGQEAYSVAILLAELSAGRDVPLNFRIFATDISETVLAAARAGVYDAEAVKNLRVDHLNKYFKKRGCTYELSSEIKNRVDFSVHDLMNAGLSCPPHAIYGDFDLVLCGNLLFYYKPEVRQGILGKIAGSLRPKGFFVTGEAETEIADRSGYFRPVAAPAAVFQKFG